MDDLRKEIIIKYRRLLKGCRNLLSSEDVNLIRKAFDIALENNENSNGRLDLKKTIKSLDIGLIIAEEIGLGRSSIISSLIYKVIVGSNIEDDYLKEMFGSTVSRIISGLRKVKQVYKQHKVVYNENFRKLLLSFSEDVRVQLIFLAQKLYHLRNIDSFPNEQAKIDLANELINIYIPFAHRLGLYAIKSEMEDKCLKVLQPKTYKSIEQKLEATSKTRDLYINKFISPLTKELDEVGIKYKIKARTKSVASILNKMKKKQVEFEEVYDIFAIRVIIDTIPKREKLECWKVYSIVSDLYMPNPNRLRDWITVPKANGYESLQTTVMGLDDKWVEVQIRTVRMDEIAEKGFAAHWKYKGGKSEQTSEQWLTDLREILENGDSEGFDLMDSFKVKLYNKEVYVFTPTGELKKLPAGASIIDFAYSIHTDIGDKCIGGKVNQKNVPLRYILNNGDTVSVITSQSQQPNIDWLNHVVTSKARNKIRQFLKEEEYKVAEIGKETLARRLKNWKIQSDDELINKLMSEFHCKLAVDLYSKIAEEKIDFTQIKEVITREVPEKIVENVEIVSAISKNRNQDTLLVDDNLSNVHYVFAKCCNPVKGDDIVGFVSIGAGIKIHRQNCKNAIDLMNRYPYRMVDAKWTSDGKTDFEVVLVILGNDELGLIGEITSILGKEFNVKMKSINISTDGGLFEGKIAITIDNAMHLTNVINNLKKIKGVTKVSRYESLVEN